MNSPAFPAKLVIERGQVRTENSNKPHGFGPIDPTSFSPFPKNPVIARFFREIGRADELGSGVRNLMKYGKIYGGTNPELTEGDIFRIIVKYPDSALYDDSLDIQQVGTNAAENIEPKPVPSLSQVPCLFIFLILHEILSLWMF